MERRRGEPKRQPILQANDEQLQDLRRRKAEVLKNKSGDDDWEGVQYIRNVKRDKSKLSREGRLRNTTSFFMSNLPVGCSSNRLWRAFVHLGNLEDAYVPHKLDGVSNGFGFIRFSGISGVESWISSLKEVTVDCAFIGVNVAKYGRDGRVNLAHSSATVEYRYLENSKGREHLWSKEGGRKHERLSPSGRPSKDPVMADECRRSQFDLWSRWFSRLYAWEGDPGEFERLAWIVVRGIPACLWDRHVFDRIGERFGRLVPKSKACVEDSNISQEKLVVLVKHGAFISEEIKVIWGGAPIRVWVHEVEEDWAPSILFPASTCPSPVEEVVVKDLEDDGAKVEESPLEILHGLHGLHGGEVTNVVGVPKVGNDEVVGDHIGESISVKACSVLRTSGLDLNAKPDDHLDSIILETSSLRKSKRKRFTADFTNTFAVSDGEPGKRKRPPPMSPVRWETENEVRSGSADDAKGAPPDGDVEREVEETIRVGESVEIVMDGFNNQVRKMVQGEKELFRSR
ncbi:hypothetical protein L1987_48145 [Smallanthus sonchifolius]|uniref:Uncharacterized protein n=1 Tax=Smallanthus sonchifolius TaxID=185202 RepID=A0ACB9FS18_9ASTR|nr:hypothetical protein L1987_48145 [Smallanthus sonchifolius]